MSVLLHISDPHFGTEQPEVVEALVDLEHRLAPWLVVLTGDVTQRARRSQFAAAAAFLARLHAPVLAVPGNHDMPLFNLPARLFQPYAGYARAFGHERAPTRAGEDFHVIGVDSTDPARHKDGHLSAVEVERVASALRMAPASCVRVVALHHPVHAITPDDEANVVHGHEHAVRTWAEAGADLILGGHIHLPYVRPLRERFADLSRDVWTVQAGTAVSQRTRGGIPNSVNVLRHDAAFGGGCDLERWDHDAAAGAFACVHAVRMTPDRTVAA